MEELKTVVEQQKGETYVRKRSQTTVLKDASELLM
jgi:hypothetical protein